MLHVSPRAPNALLALLMVCGVACQTANQAATCERDCLQGLITQYLNAVVAHDPSSLPLAENVRFTEDTVERELGEGLWQTASGLGSYRLDIIDVAESVAASQVIMQEAGPEGTEQPVMLVVRLKAPAGEITEIETMVVRSQEEGRLFAIDAIQQVSPAMARTLTGQQRLSRDEAIRTAMFYPAGLIVGDFVEVDAPFAEGAYRIENGIATAGGACARPGCENIKTQTIITHPDLTTRVAAVDEEMGIVLLRMNFGDTGSYGPGNALIVWEAFKVYAPEAGAAGQIHAVEAFMETMPAEAGSGWD